MVKPTSKTLAQLFSQEKHLENAMSKYKNNPRLVSAERITEQQIRAKGGNPNNSASDKSARMNALKRKMANNASGNGTSTPSGGFKAKTKG